jgi:hypothetical protein
LKTSRVTWRTALNKPGRISQVEQAASKLSMFLCFRSNSRRGISMRVCSGTPRTFRLPFWGSAVRAKTHLRIKQEEEIKALNIISNFKGHQNVALSTRECLLRLSDHFLLDFESKRDFKRSPKWRSRSKLEDL